RCAIEVDGLRPSGSSKALQRCASKITALVSYWCAPVASLHSLRPLMEESNASVYKGAVTKPVAPAKRCLRHLSIPEGLQGVKKRRAASLASSIHLSIIDGCAPWRDAIFDELKAKRIEEKEVAVVGAIRADEDRDELEFTELCTKLSENEEIRKILDEDFILTGMEPAEGEEVVDEVPPRGSHVELLCDLMEKAGFRKDPNRFSGDEIAPELAALGAQQTSACQDAKW
ncbi:hypothetical protein FOZ62_002153, partial [Perkinsus olseni]